MRGEHQISQARGICPCLVSRRYQKFGFISTLDKTDYLVSCERTLITPWWLLNSEALLSFSRF